MPVTVDLTKNPKQQLFFDEVMKAAYGDTSYRYFFYGGSIRGGKTFACLVSLIVLCKLFPGSKWYVIRKSFASLKETTIPTLAKMLFRSKNIRWNRDPSNYYVEFSNGSRILFAGENLAQDPELFWMLGLEANGFFLEQIEELSEIMYEYTIQRAGSWIIDNMPVPLILSTFNPTENWVKKRIYDVWHAGKLEAPYYFLKASAKDNSYVTEEQWKGWQNMDDELYTRFVEGDWSFKPPVNQFAYAFDTATHCDEGIEYIPGQITVASFDFNVEPITCLMAQHGMAWINVFKEYRLMNSDIFELCERIKSDYPEVFLLVTGDASGRSRQAISKGLRNYYKVIQLELMLRPKQIVVPLANPSVKNTRVLTNALFAKHPHLRVNPKECPYFVEDLRNVTVDENGDIDKGKDKRRTHLLDCWRYYAWQFHKNFLNNALYKYFENTQ